MYRRGPIEINRDILKTCRKRRKITDIIRLANVQYNSLIPRIDSLIEKNLIECNGNPRKTYRTTQHGETILIEIENLAEKLGMPFTEEGYL